MKKLIITTVLVIYLSTTANAGESYQPISTIVPYLISLKNLTYKIENVTKTKKISQAQSNLQPLLYQMNDLTRKITKNLETYFQNMDIIQDIMAFKKTNKQPFSNEQIKDFGTISEQINENYKELQHILISIYNIKDLKPIQQEILKQDTNFDFIQNSIKKITFYQKLALKYLDILIENSHKMIHSVL